MRKVKTSPSVARFLGIISLLRVPNGLTCSPNTIRNVIQQVLLGLSSKRTVPCLHNYVLFTSAADEQIQSLLEVFESFRSARLKVELTELEDF